LLCRTTTSPSIVGRVVIFPSGWNGRRPLANQMAMAMKCSERYLSKRHGDGLRGSG